MRCLTSMKWLLLIRIPEFKTRKIIPDNLIDENLNSIFFMKLWHSERSMSRLEIDKSLDFFALWQIHLEFQFFYFFSCSSVNQFYSDIWTVFVQPGKTSSVFLSSEFSAEWIFWPFPASSTWPKAPLTNRLLTSISFISDTSEDNSISRFVKFS